jgi:hypothetical protein
MVVIQIGMCPEPRHDLLRRNFAGLPQTKAHKSEPIGCFVIRIIQAGQNDDAGLDLVYQIECITARLPMGRRSW